MAGPNFARGAQERAAKDIGWTPLGVNVPGMGQVSFTSAGAPIFGMDPRQQQQAAMLQNLIGGLSGAAGQLQPGVAGYGQQALGAAGGLFEQLQGFDPLSAAESRYAQLSKVLAPEQARQTEQMQAQLLRQGRLGGSEGARLEAEMAAAQEAQRYGLLDRLYGEAEQSQRNMLADALSAGAAGQQTYGGLFAQINPALAAQQSIYQQPLQAYNVARTASQDVMAGKQALANALAGYNQSMAAAPSSSGLGAGLLTGLATGAATAFGGPLGGMAASGLMNAFMPAATGGGGGGNAAGYTGGMFGQPMNW